MRTRSVTHRSGGVRPSPAARLVDAVVDRGLLPDALLRLAIRSLLARRRVGLARGTGEERWERKRALVAQLAAGPVTVGVDAANAQHYEVPTALFTRLLGPHLKYSSGWWPPGVDDLATAEEAMLRLTVERADLRPGQRILDLGCGWGSLTLWIARHVPDVEVVAVSNSLTQRAHIEARAAALGLTNVSVLTADVARLGAGAEADGGGLHADVVAPASFDRVVSVELFEHVRNHRVLTERIAHWLVPSGALFVHVFAHHRDPYVFETGRRGDWMARHFFTGGLMPSHDLLPLTVRDLQLEDAWVVSGRHYARTLRAWLDRIDADRDGILAALAESDGPASPRAWLHRWRVFTIACEELFATRGGEEWHVSHYRFRRRAD